MVLLFSKRLAAGYDDTISQQLNELHIYVFKWFKLYYVYEAVGLKYPSQVDQFPWEKSGFAYSLHVSWHPPTSAHARLCLYTRVCTHVYIFIYKYILTYMHMHK